MCIYFCSRLNKGTLIETYVMIKLLKLGNTKYSMSERRLMSESTKSQQ